MTRPISDRSRLLVISFGRTRGALGAALGWLVLASAHGLACSSGTSGTSGGSPFADGGPEPFADGGASGASPCGTCGAMERLAPWPSEGHDIRGQRRSAYPGPDVAKIAWSVDSPAGGGGSGGPVVAADGSLYGAWYDGALALRPDGTTLWSEVSSTTRSVPTIGADGFLYMNQGGLVRMPMAGGARAILLKSSLGDSTPVLAEDGAIYVGGGAARAIDPSGKVSWSVPLSECAATGYCFRSAPVIAPDGSLRFSGNLVLMAIERDGTVRWTKPTTSDGRISPVVSDDGTTYVCHTDGVQAFDGDGNLLFTAGPACAFANLALGADGTIYVPGGNELVALRKDGSERFRFDYAENRGSSPAVDSEGNIFVAAGYPAATVYALDPAGKVKWTVPLEREAGSPSIGLGRRLYVPMQGGAAKKPQLVAIGGP